MKVTLKKTVGIILILVGILGMILPILPGVWFIPLGLNLVGLKLVINRQKPWREIVKLKPKKN